MDKYEFIPVDKLKDRIFDLSCINENIVKDKFIDEEIEVIYVSDNDKLVGIITPGDLIKYFARNSTVNLINKITSFINSQYSSVSELNYDQIEEIFVKYPKVNEVPVVKDNTLQGVMWNKKKECRNMV